MAASLGHVEDSLLLTVSSSKPAALLWRGRAQPSIWIPTVALFDG